MIPRDDVQVRDNLTVETLPVRIEGREVKKLRGKDIPLVKVVWGGPTGEKLDVGIGEQDAGVLSKVVCLRYIFEDENSLSWGEL